MRVIIRKTEVFWKPPSEKTEYWWVLYGTDGPMVLAVNSTGDLASLVPS